MAAMLVLVSLLILMMMTMVKSAEIIIARSGEAVLLLADLQEGGLKPGYDVRWTNPGLMVSLKNNILCKHGRCELLKNGSLRFSRVETADSGNYSMEEFDGEGKLLKKTNVLLRVEDSSSSTVLVSVLMCVFLLMLFFIIFFIVMGRRNQRARTTTGPLQENVYIVMHSNHGNKREDKGEEKEEREEESSYVACNPGVSMETPISQQTSVAGEDIYM